MRALDRRAKLLLFRLDGGLVLVLHLKIAGQLVFVAPDAPRLIGGHPYPLPDVACRTPHPLRRSASRRAGQLYVNDQRRFAWLRLLVDADAAAFVGTSNATAPTPWRRTSPRTSWPPGCGARRPPAQRPSSTRPALPAWATSTPTRRLHVARIHPLERAGAVDAGAVGRLHDAIRGRPGDGRSSGRCPGAAWRRYGGAGRDDEDRGSPGAEAPTSGTFSTPTAKPASCARSASRPDARAGRAARPHRARASGRAGAPTTARVSAGAVRGAVLRGRPEAHALCGRCLRR